MHSLWVIPVTLAFNWNSHVGMFFLPQPSNISMKAYSCHLTLCQKNFLTWWSCHWIQGDKRLKILKEWVWRFSKFSCFASFCTYRIFFHWNKIDISKQYVFLGETKWKLQMGLWVKSLHNVKAMCKYRCVQSLQLLLMWKLVSHYFWWITMYPLYIPIENISYIGMDDISQKGGALLSICVHLPPVCLRYW